MGPGRRSSRTTWPGCPRRTHPGDKTITYSYDEVGNREATVDPAEGRTTYSYDDAYQLAREQRSPRPRAPVGHLVEAMR